MSLNSVPTPVQIDKAALERSEQAREQYRARIHERYLPGQLVFVDESASDCHIRRHYGCLLCGERAHKKSVFLRGKRYV